MLKKLIFTLTVIVSFFLSSPSFSTPRSIYNIKLKTLEGDLVDFSAFKNEVLLIVNTASKCGFTPQYKDLESLSTKYSGDHIKILGFPSNDFGNTEPADNKEIKKFCKLRYGVTFPLFEKSSVSGATGSVNPVFQILTEDSSQDLKGKVEWNFEKFVVDKKGVLRARFGPSTNPASSKITNLIDELSKE